MWKNRVRTLVTIAGVILSAAMFTAVLTMAVSLLDFLIGVEVYEEGGYYLACNLTDETTGQTLRAEKAVDALGDYQAMGYVQLGEEFILAAVDEPIYELAAVRADEGRLPRDGTELLLSPQAAAALQNMALPHRVGEQVTLEALPQSTQAPDLLPAGSAAQSRQYTIVGISDSFLSLGGDAGLGSILTAADGTQSAIWHTYYVTTSRPDAAIELSRTMAERCDTWLHYSLLTYFGESRYSNFNSVMLNFALILCAIIMVGSVSLIYNAFSISVSERTRQFGLLRSLGATKRQLRRSVFFEAGSLCALGIPLGLLCGWGGIAITLHFVGDMFGSMLNGSQGAAVSLRAVVSAPALLLAALVCLLTVLLSAWLPAHRATRVAPLAAIRQNADYRVRARQVRVSRLSWRIWGLPAVLARKYYAVSRRKYRATVVSLAVSILLFISSFSFAALLRESASETISLENYDFLVSRVTRETAQSIRSRSDVKAAALVSWDIADYMAVVPEAQVEPDFLAQTQKATPAGTEPLERNCWDCCIYYLEDAVLEQWLLSQGIDPAPYWDTETPCALLCNKQLADYLYDEQTGEYTRRIQHFVPFSEGIETLPLLCSEIPEALFDAIPETEYEIDFVAEAGRFLLRMIPWEATAEDGRYLAAEHALWFELVQDEATLSYYAYDRESAARAMAPTCTVDATTLWSTLRIGAAIDELPFGIPEWTQRSAYQLYFILPLSMQKQPLPFGPDLALQTSNYESLRAWLSASELPYADELREEMQVRNIILLVNVFSYGFIILIALICVCNVFNTISTNIALRRRDFGMLRSVGLKTRELYRMMHFECLRYGLMALLVGLPPALLCSYWIQRSGSALMGGGWQPPWFAIAVAAGCTFLVVFAAMLYAVNRLRRDNPIEAIRMENL